MLYDRLLNVTQILCSHRSRWTVVVVIVW